MALHYWWWLLAITLSVAEILTGGFYLLMLAAGAAAGGVAGAIGFGLTWQFVCAAVVSAVGAYLVHRLRPLRANAVPSERNPDVNLDIGRSVQVERWDAHGHARVSYRGALWDVELLPGEPAVPGKFVIREIRGSRLRLGLALEANPAGAAHPTTPANPINSGKH